MEIERYTLPQMKRIWSDEYKYELMLKVELLACEAHVKLKNIPASSFEIIKKRAKFSLERIKQIEKKTRHDVIAFLINLSENIGKEARFLHLGLTSYDVVDNVLILRLIEAAKLILSKLEELSDVLKEKANKYKYTLMMGRTHGVYAEPITFGFKLATFYFENKRNIERLKRAIEDIRVGKLSGSVGSYANIDPKVEEYVLSKLGLKVATGSTQIIQRDIHAQFLLTLALIATSFEKFSTEIRLLHRSEIQEVQEAFFEEQMGSSAMPHKKNPIITERICGLARVIKSNALVALENISLWNERDITHSSAERIIMPQVTLLLYYIVHNFIEVMNNLEIYEDVMMQHIKAAKGLYYSEALLIKLRQAGLCYEGAYKIVQDIAAEVKKTDIDFDKLATQNEQIKKYLSLSELSNLFNINNYLRHIDYIFSKF